MMAHVPFWWEDFSSVVGKVQWVLLPYSVAKELLGLRLTPPGVKEERDRQPWWIGDFSFGNLNSETLPIAALYAMKYGWALYRLVGEVIIA